MRIRLIFYAVISVALSVSNGASAALQVVTTTPDLAALVRTVGGEFVHAEAIAKGTQDPHRLEAKPSFMVKLRSADLVVEQGLDLESAWLKSLLEGARNPRVMINSTGFLSLGEKLDPLEAASGPVSRADGDVHPKGNPHFHLDPIRLSQAALLIAGKLGELDPTHLSVFQKNAADFVKLMKEKTKLWQARIDKSGVREVTTYHKTLSYFFARFGIRNSLQLEPRPGIPPTPKHILSLIQDMRARSVTLILVENLFDVTEADKIKESLPSVRVALVPVYVGGEPEIKTNEQLIERLVSAIADIP